MWSLKTILIFIFGLNIFGMTYLAFTTHHTNHSFSPQINLNAFAPDPDILVTIQAEEPIEPIQPIERLESQESRELEVPKKPVYKFEDPFLAYQLLEQLDIFEMVQDGQLRKTKYKKNASRFVPNNYYCEAHRAYFVGNPSFLFEKMNFISNYWRAHKIKRQVIPSLGVDLHPRKKKNMNMRVDASLFIMFNLFFYKRQIGKQFSCLSQASNHIPGHDKMYRKDSVGKALVEYAKGYESRPECFNFNKHFPKTWVLKQKDQCKDFFAEFNSERYKELKQERNIVYFRKIGANVHEGKGVFPMNDKEEAKLRKKYKNGKKCGRVKKNNLIQYNVYNLLLINNRKFGFRMFLLVASTNPVLAYYHDGYARLSLNEYNPNSQEKSTFVTNIGVNLKKSGKELGLTKTQVQESTLWFLSDVQNYLLEKGKIDDPNWLDNYFRPEMKKVMIHLVRMAQSGFFKLSSVFCLFGLDFVMDENLDLWFIEANSKPLVGGFTTASTIMFNQMLTDAFEIEMGLIRSRMKRVINYINMLIKDGQTEEMDDATLERRRQEFKEITMNYFEPEFVPRSENTFKKIIDDREIGIERYAGLIREECL